VHLTGQHWFRLRQETEIDYPATGAVTPRETRTANDGVFLKAA